MHLQMKQQTTINAPAADVWRVIAHEFAQIGEWASFITDSEAVEDIAPPAGATVGGRAFSGAFGDVQEGFTYYDEEAMHFGYTGIGDPPAFIKDSENNWTVRALGSDKSVVESRAEMEFNLFPGLLLMPVIKMQMGRMSPKLLAELKYYVEHGQPHPRKVAAAAKQLKTA